MKYISIQLNRRPVIIVLASAVCAFLLTNVVSSESSMRSNSRQSQPAVRMFDIGLGPHNFNLQLGRDTQTRYLGAPELQQAVQSTSLQPRSMVSDDFNVDGMGDLVIGYASGNGGVLGLRQGNLQALAPTDPAILEGVGQGRYPSPFLPDVTLYSSPEAPDFLQVGDFNSDGYSDVMAAARMGQRLYLFPGDGQGHLGEPQSFHVEGLLTAMQAGREQPGRFTSLAVGLLASGGAKLSVYNDSGPGLAGAPESYPMPSEVTALTFGDLNKDGIPDVAAASGNEVGLVYQHENVPVPFTAETNEQAAASEASSRSNSPIERTTYPFVIRGLAAGNFVFDREHQTELALLTDGGAVHLTNKGETDRRPFSKKEIAFIQEQRKAWHKGEQDMEALGRQMEKLVRASSKNLTQAAGWTVTETLNTGAAAPYTGAPGLLKAARMTGLALDDLLIGNSADNSVQVVKNKEDIQKLNYKNGEVLAQTNSVKLDGEPLAAISMRLSVNGLPGTVVLNADQIEPQAVIVTPDAVFAVTTTLDQVDLTPGNGVCNSASGCSLRAAVIESNYAGGSNSITLPNGTYTLTLGPWDDEFNANGAVMESGDLDILDLSAFVAVPALTAVTINGGGRDTAIIQMGTLVPGSGGISTDRVLETNNFAIPQRGTSLTLNNLTVRNGNAQKTPAPDNYNTKGGGIQFDGFDSFTNSNLGVLTLTNSKFTTNTAAGQGGGILAIFGGLTVQTTSIVSSNTSTFAAGGGIQHSGGNVITTTLNITNSTIGGATAPEGNNAADATFGIGGGMDSVGANAVNITGSTIRNNTGGITAGSNGGGGLHFGNSKSIAISTSTISDNKSKHHGGGIWVSARDAVSNLTSTFTLTTVNVTGNQADSDNSGAGDGGGLYAFFGSGTVQTTSHIDGNTAVNGGGISTAWSGIGTDPAAGLTVNTSSTIGQAGAGNGNSARGNGGSIYINATGATLFNPINLTALTFTNNVANSDSVGGGDGGAIFIGAGQLTSLSGCTIDGNVANSGTGDGIRQTGGTITGAGTLNVNGGDSISISGGTFTSTSGTLNLTGNLLFTGGTFTHNSGTWVMNGSSAQTIGTSPITFFNLTINNGAGVSLGGTATVAGTLNLTNGVLGVGTNTLTLTGPVSFTSGSISSSPTGTVNYSQTVANQNVAPGTYGNLFFNNFVKVLPNGLTVNIAGTFTPGTAAPTITGSTVDFNGAGVQTVPVMNYNNLTISGNRGGANVTLASGTIGVAGIFNPSATNVVYVKSGNTFDFNGAGAQTIPAFNYNNLTVSNTHGANPVTLVNGGIIGVAGTFTPGTSIFTITGNTMDFNGTGAQTIPVFNFNNLTISGNHGGLTVTLAPGNIGVAGVFNPSATNVVYAKTANTFDFNGAGTQTIPAFDFNNLTVSNTHGANAVTLVNGGTIGVAGVFTPGTSTFVNTGNTMNFNGAGVQTIPAFNFNNLTVSNTHGANAVTLVNGGTIGVAGVFTPGTSTFVIAGNTMDFNGAGVQTIPAFNFNNLTVSNTHGANAVTLVNGGTIGVAGVFTPGTSTFVVTGNTFAFNGAGAQTVPAFNFNNLTISNTHGANVVTLVNGGTIGIAGTFTPGTSTFAITGNTIDFNGSGGQTIPAFNYNNLTSSNTGARTLANAGTIGIASVFTPGTNAYTITGSTINFNGAGAQSIPGFTYNNLTSSGGGAARTLDPVNTIKIAGVFTPGTDSYIITGSTVEYNGSAAQTLPPTFTTYNNLTLNNPTTVGGFAGLIVQGLLRVQAGTFTSSSTYNNVQIDLGATLAGTAATTINVSGNWTNNGTFTPNTNTVNFNGAGPQVLSGTPTAQSFHNFTITKSADVLSTSGGTTSLTINNDFTFTSGTFTAPANINVAGNWIVQTGAVFTPGSGTVTFTSTGARTLSAAATLLFNNLVINKTGGGSVTGLAPTTGLTLNGGLTLTAGTFAAGSITNINIAGNWTNNAGLAAFTPGVGTETVTFNGSLAQTIGGSFSTTFNNLTDANPAGLTLGIDTTVNKVLDLGANTINTGSFTLIMPNTGSSTGTGDVVGNVRRTGFAVGVTQSFGNPLNTIKFESGATPDVTVNLVLAAPGSFPAAVKRTYTITPSGANGPVTLRLHYLDTDLNGNDENTIVFRRFNGATWDSITPSTRETTANYLEVINQATLSPWTFSAPSPTAANGTIAGHIADGGGQPVAGAVVYLSGTQTRKTITDASGNYSFANVETVGFYTVRAARANYSFSPQERSFSQIGNRTEAAFTATALAMTANPLDTPEYFVRQHYLDFLGREPDENGFNYWSDQVLDCGGDAACVEVKRINVSAAYFLSIEFQATGGLVDGLYRASFDRAPQYAEFMPDTAQLAQNVIVGRGDWAEQLDANREAFLNAYVGRPEFQSVYGGLNNDQYVDQLLTHTRIIWTAGERAGLVSGLANGTLTRAEVLGQIAADPRYMAAKRNETFVMMEYFGYLRRDPDADGYQFWLNKLNQYGGNFVQAEMVKAFISSIEYRQRFSR